MEMAPSNHFSTAFSIDFPFRHQSTWRRAISPSALWLNPRSFCPPALSSPALHLLVALGQDGVVFLVSNAAAWRRGGRARFVAVVGAQGRDAGGHDQDDGKLRRCDRDAAPGDGLGPAGRRRLHRPCAQRRRWRRYGGLWSLLCCPLQQMFRPPGAPPAMPPPPVSLLTAANRHGVA